jgi:hypothetical protein
MNVYIYAFGKDLFFDIRNWHSKADARLRIQFLRQRKQNTYPIEALHTPLKRRYTPRIHGAISQKALIF